MAIVAQGRHGSCSIAAVPYPVINWRLEEPRNIAVPMPAGNSFATHFAEGLKTSRLTINFDVRTKATEVLALAFWNLFLSRTWASGNDDTAALAVLVNNGQRLYTGANVKAESFTLTIQKGMQIGLQAVFVAPDQYVVSNGQAIDYTTTFDSSAPLMADAASFTGITGDTYGFELNYGNGHLPNGRLDGTKHLLSWDAGTASCGATMTFPAPASGAAPFADGQAITLALAGGVTRTFSLTSAVPNNPDSADADIGQRFVSWQCAILGSAGVPPVWPLVVT